MTGRPTSLAALRRLASRPHPLAIVFLICFVFFTYFFHRFRFWNVNSRLALTYAIVEDGSFRIDRFVNHPYFETKDRAFYNGHYYSDKIIGLSLLAVPPYWLLKHAADLVGWDPKPDASRYALTVAIVSTCASGLAVVMGFALLLLGQPMGMACTTALLLAFGTPLLPFSSLFYPYLPALFFLMAGLYLILRWQSSTDEASRPPWLTGFFFGLALLCEYTLAVPVALLSLYILTDKKFWKGARGRTFFKRFPLHLFLFLLSMAAPLSLFALYNWICFDTPFTLPYRYLESPEFKDGMSQGLMGIHKFQWYVLYLITVHPYRGLFFYSPVMLLGFLGLARALKRGSGHERLLAAISLAIVIYYLILNASYYMWWGGEPRSRAI